MLYIGTSVANPIAKFELLGRGQPFANLLSKDVVSSIYRAV